MAKSIIIIIVLMFVIALLPTSDNYSWSAVREETLVCHQLTGEIIDKEPPVTIIITVDDTYVTPDNLAGIYYVYVSPEAYSTYIVGDIHIEETCDVNDYAYYLEIFDRLIEMGVVSY